MGAAANSLVSPSNPEALISVRHMTMAYGSFVLMRDLNFAVRRGDIFIIMGGSGCGKSTVLRHLIGLKEPAKGEIYFTATSTLPKPTPGNAKAYCGALESCTKVERSGVR